MKQLGCVRCGQLLTGTVVLTLDGVESDDICVDSEGRTWCDECFDEYLAALEKKFNRILGGVKDA